MPIYEPLRNAMKDLRDTMYRHEAEMERIDLYKRQQADQHEQRMMEMQMRQDQQIQKAKAQQYFAEQSAALLSQNPIEDRRKKIAQIDAELPQLKAQANSIKTDVHFRKEHLLARQNIMALQSERDTIAAELADAPTMINEYMNLANEGNKSALVVSQWDPQTAQIFGMYADNARAQANMLMQAENMKSQKKGKIIEILDEQTGKTLRVEELMPGVTLNLGPGETTRFKDPTNSSQMLRFYDPNDDYKEVGARMVNKDAGKGHVNANKKSVAKEKGIEDWKSLVTEVPEWWARQRAGGSSAQPGHLTEDQTTNHIAIGLQKEDPKMVGTFHPIEGLGDKVRYLKGTMRSNMPGTAAERVHIAEALRRRVDAAEHKYWADLRVLMRAANQLKKEDFEREKQDLLDKFHRHLRKLSQVDGDPNDPGITYMPDYYTRSNLGIKWDN